VRWVQEARRAGYQAGYGCTMCGIVRDARVPTAAPNRVVAVWLGTVLLACLLELVAQSRGGTKAMPNIAETLWQVY
jgi:hypothetical protein